LCGAKCAVSDDSQVHVPESFLALYVSAGRYRKLTVSREHLEQRYELCEDLAHLLCDSTREKAFGGGVDEQEVLLRTWHGLRDGSAVLETESVWVVRRLAELLDWPLPGELVWRAEEG
jgi:hypothetical protein